MPQNISPLIALHQNQKNKELAQQFSKIVGNGIPFIAPQEMEVLIQEIPAFCDQLIGLLGFKTKQITWDLKLINNMLEKGYNPSALASTFSSANQCISDLSSLDDSEKPVSIVELGTGAGWSTLILYNLLRNNFKNFTFSSIDVSPYAVGCTAKMLDHFGIPYKIFCDDRKILASNEEINAPVVILHCQDFNSKLEQILKNSINFVYSNHGTAYLDSQTHAKMMVNVHSALTSNGFFIADSLDPQVSINLSKFFVIGSVLLGNNRKRFKKVQQKDLYLYRVTKSGEIKLIKFYDKSAANFLDWLSYLLYSGHLTEFKKYLSALRRSVTSQQEIRNWVKNTSKTVFVENKNSKASLWKQVELPEQIQGPITQTVKLSK